MEMSARSAGAAVRKPARSLAERARGFSSASASLAAIIAFPMGSKVAGLSCAIGMWRDPEALPDRSEKNFLTIRSSSEWKVTTTNRPPGFSARSAAKRRLSELAEFIIDKNSKRLEHPGRRMDLVLGLARRHDLDQPGKIARRAEGIARAPLFDGPGNTAGLFLLSQESEDANEIGDLCAVNDVGGGHSLTRHAHIQGSILLERETALRFVDLHRGDADIEHDAVEPAWRRILIKP